jgi:flagellar protein FliS
MLIEGAIRFGRQAEIALRRGDEIAASAPLLRVIDIVGEMLAGVRQRKSDINKRLADLYWFIFRCVSEAKIDANANKLAEALRLLEYERQTWLAVTEKLATADDAGSLSAVASTRAADRSAGQAQISWDA